MEKQFHYKLNERQLHCPCNFSLTMRKTNNNENRTGNLPNSCCKSSKYTKNPRNVYLLFLILLVDGGQAAPLVIQAHAETQKLRSLRVSQGTEYSHPSPRALRRCCNTQKIRRSIKPLIDQTTCQLKGAVRD